MDSQPHQERIMCWKKLSTRGTPQCWALLLLFFTATITISSAFPLNFHPTRSCFSCGLSDKNARRRQALHAPLHAAELDPTLHQPNDDEITLINGHLPPRISDLNVQLNTSYALVYDPAIDRFVRASSSQGLAALYSVDSVSENISTRIRRAIKHSFVPEGVNKSYFHFMRWRIIQRFINSNLHVLGTQSLIMGLGIKSAKTLGVSAALTWVLKDALGKLTRLVWASRMGRRFDSDAKRWRFRASLVYALGNYLEIVTYVNPRLFLLWATIANSCKQVAMLTSSATRTSLYNSFRDGKRENIADITAKGEAQIAIVDLVGIAVGVTVSKLIGTSVKSILSTYFILQTLELLCLYRQIRGVEFKVMNFERMTKVIECFCDGIELENEIGLSNSTNGTTNGRFSKVNFTASIPSPEETAQTECIFLPPKHLQRRALAFGSLGRTQLNPEELSKLIELFAGEKYMLIVGENTKHPHRRREIFKKASAEEKIQQSCHIVLHEEASNLDIVKSTLALQILRRKLLASNMDASVTKSLRSSDCWDLFEDVRRCTDIYFPSLLRQLSVKGWASPSRSMFGRVSRRASWALGQKPSLASKS